ncbi:MAG: TetR/AcrR family transcriptional regulator [Pseudonocardia sp.]|nr:TetR/AcrR family transcriptional regulator [Pseudonocardia sp.]
MSDGVAARSDSKSARARERILDAAAEVLNRNGYAGTRLSDIAEIARLQAPAIYYYFPSRDDVIQEVVQVGLRRTMAHVEESPAAMPGDGRRTDARHRRPELGTRVVERRTRLARRDRAHGPAAGRPRTRHRRLSPAPGTAGQETSEQDTAGQAGRRRPGRPTPYDRPMPRRTPRPEPEAPGSKSAQTRGRLLDAAATVLARKGFTGSRLVDIAEQAQVRAPAIYYYFPSREDLIEEVMFVGAEAMRTHLADALAALPPGTSPTERIAAAVASHLHHELEISDYSRAIIRNGNQLPEQVGDRAMAEVAGYNEIWRGLVADLAAAGQLRSDLDPAVARMMVLGSLNWAVEWWAPERGPIDELIRTAQSMVLHALRP